jgi:hypothetical protein
MLGDARIRAKKANVPFSITEADIKYPKVCPILNLKLDTTPGSSTDTSPSLDRVVPSRGYVPGNIQIISNRANILKRDASMVELYLLGQYAKRVGLPQ